MCRLRLIRILQEDGSDIVLAPRGEALSSQLTSEIDENDYR